MSDGPGRAAMRRNVLKRVAYHEAGHAVMAVVLDLPLSRARVFSRTDGIGGTATVPPLPGGEVLVLSSREAYLYARDRIDFCLAGLAAEHLSGVPGRLADEETFLASVQHDYQSACEMACWCVRAKPSDTIAGRQIRYVVRRQRLVRNRISQHAKAVHEVAAAIRKRRSLTGDEVRAIVRGQRSRPES